MGERQPIQRVRRCASSRPDAPLRTCCLIAAAFLLAGLSDIVAARTFETRKEALERVFPKEATILRRTVFLSAEQVEAAQQRGHSRIAHERITYYIATVGDSITGYAYIDTHPVRSMQETLLIVIRPEGSIVSIDVLAFHEPQDYLPTQRWFTRLAQHPSPHRAVPGDGVDAVSGATLSSRAACDALRRVSSIDHILHHAEEHAEP